MKNYTYFCINHENIKKMYTLENLNDVITIISSSIILLLAFLLSVLKTQPIEGFKNYQKIRVYLSVSYFILGMAGIANAQMFSNFDFNINKFVMSVALASFQTLFFTASHMLLLKPRVLSTREINLYFVGIVIFTISALAICSTDFIPYYAIISVTLIAYLILQIVYFRKFYDVYRTKLKFKELYYNEKHNLRLKSIIVSFCIAISIGYLSIIIQFLGMPYFMAFKVMYTFYYLYFFVLLFNRLAPIVSISGVINSYNKSDDDNISEQNSDVYMEQYENTMEETSKETDFDVLKERLRKWVQDKGFTDGDMSVDEVADILDTNRMALRKYFRDQIHCDFRTWRMELRLEEAKKLLITNPEYTISQIALMVGFNNRSNFFTRFNKTTGMSPTEWREMHGINAE